MSHFVTPLFAEENDFPEDCHRHCTHYDKGEECCECGEEKQEPTPINEFLASLEES